MAPLDNAGNFDRQDLTSSVGTNDPETVDVTDASALPDPATDAYNIVIWDAGTYARPDQDPGVEIARVTARDTTADTITVNRGQEGTSAVSHPGTSEIMSAFTAKMVSDLDGYLNEVADFTVSPTEVTAPVNNGSVTTEKINTEVSAQDGIVQSAVDNAAPGGKVTLRPDVVYDEGTEIHLKEDVTLDFNGAKLEISSDHNGIFMDHGSRLVDPWIDCFPAGGSYSSNAIVVDSGRAGGAYRLNDKTNVRIDGTARIIGPNFEGTGLYLHSTASGSISFGNRMDLIIRGFDDQVDAHADGQFINGSMITATMTNAGTHFFRHRGSGPCMCLIQAVIQPHTNTDYGIRNETSEESFEARVRFWDTSRFNQNPVDGQNLRIHSWSLNHIDIPSGASHSGSWVTTFSNGRLHLVSLESGTSWELTNDPDNNELQFGLNQVARWKMEGNGRFISTNKSIHLPTYSNDPVSAELDDGMCTMYVSDGSAGVTGDDGDVILAVNNGGTVKTATLADFSAI